MAGSDRSEERTVPTPSRMPVCGGRMASVGVRSTSHSAKTRFARAETFSVCPSAHRMTPGRTQAPMR